VCLLSHRLWRSLIAAKPGIENPVVVRSTDGQWFISVYHIYTGASIGVSYSANGLHWTRQAGDLRLGTGFCEYRRYITASPTR
jgi:hypothetical protein